jgi:hypothetical protein
VVVFEHRLDINDRSTIDCLQTLHQERAGRIYIQDLHTVQAYRIWPVRRTGCKHSHHRIQHITSRMDLEGRAPRFMEPRENPNVLARLDAVDALGEGRIDFQPRIWRPLPSLTGSAGTLLEGGTHIADRSDIEILRNIQKRVNKKERGQPC